MIMQSLVWCSMCIIVQGQLHFHKSHVVLYASILCSVQVRNVIIKSHCNIALCSMTLRPCVTISVDADCRCAPITISPPPPPSHPPPPFSLLICATFTLNFMCSSVLQYSLYTCQCWIGELWHVQRSGIYIFVLILEGTLNIIYCTAFKHIYCTAF